VLLEAKLRRVIRTALLVQTDSLSEELRDRHRGSKQSEEDRSVGAISSQHLCVCCASERASVPPVRADA